MGQSIYTMGMLRVHGYFLGQPVPNVTHCFQGNRICESGENLSQQSYIIPSAGKRKTLRVSLKELRCLHDSTSISGFADKYIYKYCFIMSTYYYRQSAMTLLRYIRNYSVLKKLFANTLMDLLVLTYPCTYHRTDESRSEYFRKKNGKIFEK
jgi:hypothetical protein